MKLHTDANVTVKAPSYCIFFCWAALIGMILAESSNTLRAGSAAVGEDRARASVPGLPSSHRCVAAPNFSLAGLNREQISLATYRGKVVILNLWAAWCAPCRTEIPRFIEFEDKYRQVGLQIIGIAMDDDDQPVRDMYRELHMNYPVGLANNQVRGLYGGTVGLPTTFVIGREGCVDDTVVGVINPRRFADEIRTLLGSRASTDRGPPVQHSTASASKR
jgi:thiol-disulfide isomerase/thioredoxin